MSTCTCICPYLVTVIYCIATCVGEPITVDVLTRIFPHSTDKSIFQFYNNLIATTSREERRNILERTTPVIFGIIKSRTLTPYDNIDYSTQKCLDLIEYSHCFKIFRVLLQAQLTDRISDDRISAKFIFMLDDLFKRMSTTRLKHIMDQWITICVTRLGHNNRTHFESIVFKPAFDMANNAHDCLTALRFQLTDDNYKKYFIQNTKKGAWTLKAGR